MPDLNPTMQADKDLFCRQDLHPAHKLPNRGFFPCCNSGRTVLHDLQCLLDAEELSCCRYGEPQCFFVSFQIRHFLGQSAEANRTGIVANVCCGLCQQGLEFLLYGHGCRLKSQG